MLRRFTKTLSALEHNIGKIPDNSTFYSRMTNDNIYYNLCQANEKKWEMFVTHNLCLLSTICMRDVNLYRPLLINVYDQYYSDELLMYFNNCDALTKIRSELNNDDDLIFHNYAMSYMINNTYNMELLYMSNKNFFKKYDPSNEKKKFMSRYLSSRDFDINNYSMDIIDNQIDIAHVTIKNSIESECDHKTFDRMDYYFELHDEYVDLLEKL